MYALCSDAMLKAITRQARAVDEKVKTHNATHTPNITIAYFFDHLAADEDTAVMVTEDDFVEAHKELVPSVSADELRHYDTVRKSFEGAGKKEDEKKDVVPTVNGGTTQRTSSSRGNGPAKSPGEDDDQIMRVQNMNLNGSATGESESGKGKGKAPVVNHRGKSSVDIAEGGFGEATQDDDLYS